MLQIIVIVKGTLTSVMGEEDVHKKQDYDSLESGQARDATSQKKHGNSPFLLIV